MSNSNTNSTFSFDAWEKSALSELNTLQNHVSKALMKYQSNTEKPRWASLQTAIWANSEPLSRASRKPRQPFSRKSTRLPTCCT